MSIPSRGQQTEGRRPTPSPTAKEGRALMSLSRETVVQGRKPRGVETVLGMSGPAPDSRNRRRLMESLRRRTTKPTRREEGVGMSLPRGRR